MRELPKTTSTRRCPTQEHGRASSIYEETVNIEGRVAKDSSETNRGWLVKTRHSRTASTRDVELMGIVLEDLTCS